MSRPEDGVVVFLDRNSAAVGMGIVVDRGHVLACAHVVNVALAKVENCQEVPQEPVEVIFPYSATDRNARPIVVRIQGRGWHAPPVQGQSMSQGLFDIAVVELQEDTPGDI